MSILASAPNTGKQRTRHHAMPRIPGAQARFFDREAGART
jgi:hypothetical protein